MDSVLGIAHFRIFSEFRVFVDPGLLLSNAHDVLPDSQPETNSNSGAVFEQYRESLDTSPG